ncbi:kinase-like domain-containing protein [Gigaspora rosea]|uniref:Kinase-like domain-containing protein n=1 Tax=Gigaspora rosea TaxID=44941 RepID=A0A397VGN8_9GLOM|nr:kinase-like domain-containing protein [Gigaspora rosea]
MLFPLLGITKNPETSKYIIVLKYAQYGNLRDNLRQISGWKWEKRLFVLFHIVSGLVGIYQSGIVHKDLHGGNILLYGVLEGYHVALVSDLGLAAPIHSEKNELYGVIPYTAPEMLLRGKYYRCSKSADIYSLAIIMWEIASGEPAFGNAPHNTDLCLGIVSGSRPYINNSTPRCYASLMKKWWDLDPLQRPTANELKKIIGDWLRNSNDEFLQADKKLQEHLDSTPQTISKCQLNPEAFYTSRLLNPLSLGNLNKDGCQIKKSRNLTFINENSDQNNACYQDGCNYMGRAQTM